MPRLSHIRPTTTGRPAGQAARARQRPQRPVLAAGEACSLLPACVLDRAVRLWPESLVCSGRFAKIVTFVFFFKFLLLFVPSLFVCFYFIFLLNQPHEEHLFYHYFKEPTVALFTSISLISPLCSSSWIFFRRAFSKFSRTLGSTISSLSSLLPSVFKAMDWLLCAFFFFLTATGQF